MMIPNPVLKAAWKMMPKRKLFALAGVVFLAHAGLIFGVVALYHVVL